MRKRLRLAIVLAVIVLIVAGWWGIFYAIRSSEPPSDIFASGFIEATSVTIAPEIGGRILSIAAAEGDEVKAGVPLVRLDDSLLKAQQRQAEAALRAARAGREQASATREGARKAWEDALDVQAHPLELEARIIVAEGQLGTAELALAQANDNYSKLTYPYTFSTFAFDVPGALGDIGDARRQVMAAQELLKAGPDSARYQEGLSQLQKAEENLARAIERLARGQGEDVIGAGSLPVKDFWTLRAAQLQKQTAETALETARRTLQNLREVKSKPQELNATVNKARAAYDAAVAAVSAAESQVELAEASQELLRVQLAKTTLTSSLPGVVAARNAEAGELAQAGVPILTITELGEVTLTAFVAESRIGLVRLGQEAVVSVDSYPGQDFSGRVVFISPQAQFTPKNVQLKEEREKTVFAVKIRLPNPEQKLKQGMPADARLLIPQSYQR